MTPRKHLWSDGWEEDLEPAGTPSAPASAPATEPAPDPAPDPAPARVPRGRSPRTIAAVGAGVLVAAAAVWSIAAPRHAHRTPGPVAAAHRPAATPGRPDALGLELAGAPGHRVVVRGVVPGSPATSVGIGAGQDLLAINGHAVTAPGQVDEILGRLPLGSPVTLQLTEGGAQITAEIQEPGIP
ncbi:PDZ domain-containing protein [Paraconexibacter antarcticus]|uniref:PDZ domain-containing protein n=1 Tax=Paraconexibacter antarcticus TaxID=2949664 RepID=A0ABY5DKW6_9ACTN|nr:PDZ domain-containing protein [Paraconexibacter antarcticus]UTI62403.1 PDZ domain-containing protein [Paraconexibacter antarcticus]